MSTKYQVFISSTYEDLKPEREQIIKAVLEMGHIPVGMEMFSAADDQQWAVIQRQIEQSDYYVVIVAHRYGSMDGAVSYTEKEYDYAIKCGIPVLGFTIEPDAAWPSEWVEKDTDVNARLTAFKSKVRDKMVSHWKTAEDLYGRCGIALMKTFASTPREGWVRASTAGTGEMPGELTRLSKENGQLRIELRTARQAIDSDAAAEIEQIISALKRNGRRVYVRDVGTSEWGDPVETDLLRVFEVVAPQLLDDAANKDIANCIAFDFSGISASRHHWLVPTNHITGYISDFASLDLISSSQKKRSVKDTKSYWTLTEFGRSVHSSIRRHELIEGSLAPIEDPEDDGDETTETEYDDQGLEAEGENEG